MGAGGSHSRAVRRGAQTPVKWSRDNLLAELSPEQLSPPRLSPAPAALKPFKPPAREAHLNDDVDFGDNQVPETVGTPGQHFREAGPGGARGSQWSGEGERRGEERHREARRAQPPESEEEESRGERSIFCQHLSCAGGLFRGPRAPFSLAVSSGGRHRRRLSRVP